MNNKTCNNCKHCENKQIIATCKHIGVTVGECPGEFCSHFEENVVNNGDKFRRYSNREFSELFALLAMCDFCPARTDNCGEGGSDIKKCRKAWQKWLDLPTESEVEDE